MRSFVRSLVSFLFVSGFISACASRENVADSYSQVLKESAIRKKSTSTTIYFLVDGLPIGALSSELNRGKLPHINSFFIGPKRQFNVARVPFPSLTYPSISALLTEKPVNQSGIFGNLIISDKQIYDFELIENVPKLNELIKDRNIFSRLNKKGLRSVSFDYIFHSDTSAHSSISDINVGFAVAEKNYKYVDSKTLDSLKILLKKTPIDEWPEFIFVHLVGVDFTSHDQGPRSPMVEEYIEKLDSKFASVFEIFSKAENWKHHIVAILSADHGFDETIKKVIGVEREIHDEDSNIIVLNEGRYLALYFPTSWSEDRKSHFLNMQIQNPDIDIVGYRDHEKILVQSQNLSTMIFYNEDHCPDSNFKISILKNPLGVIQTSAPRWTCPDLLDSSSNSLFYPYFIPNISRYFSAENHPDAVIISKPGIAFDSKYHGQHGGPTIQETFVPLLLHGAKINEDHGIPPVWDLLKFL